MSTAPTILLAAHGARTGSASNERIEALASRLRARRPDLTFQPAFNLGEPRFPDALPPTGDVIVVPIMTGRGYFVDERLPEELATSPHFDASRLTITSPVGTHARIVEQVVADGVKSWMGATGCTQPVRSITGATTNTGCVQPVAPDRLFEPVVLVVAHGTGRDAKSREGGEQIAAMLRDRLPNADVRATFLDDEPLLEDVATTLPPDAPIVVVPWLWGGGGHFDDDIRERLGDAFARATVNAPIGELAALDDAVLELIDAALRAGAPLASAV